MKRHFTQDKATRPLSEVSEDQIYSVGLHMDVSSLFSPKSLMGGPLLVAPNPVPPIDKETYWRRNDSSVNAVSFGFVATAILIFMFLVMAIFERILRSRPPIPLVSAIGDSESGIRESPRPQTPIKMDSTVEACSLLSSVLKDSCYKCFDSCLCSLSSLIVTYFSVVSGPPCAVL
eukprot:c27361_g1_i4 orf=1437-1961(+)